MTPRPKIDVIIPTYKPDRSLRDLIRLLLSQSVELGHILVVNTCEEYWNDNVIKGLNRVEVFHISKKEFDHAETRNFGAGFSDADYLLFMTQDAVPVNRYMVERLLDAFRNPVVKAAYARQLPRKDCILTEGCVRYFNYPPVSAVHTYADLPELGIKTYCCSNVCAMYEYFTFRKMGGFSAPAIFNEDMVYAARIEHLGYGVAYAADALVYHSHNYTNRQQFRRNFDNGVSQAMHPEIFSSVPSAHEGSELVKYVLKFLRQKGRIYLIPGFLVQCACRLAGFRLGRMYKYLPPNVVRRCSSNPEFFSGKH